jgi:hypothetical protein
MAAAMIIGCNYGSGRYVRHVRNQAEQYPIDFITREGDNKGTKGDNWWRWKPELILIAMEQTKPDTFILYVDAGDIHAEEFWQFLYHYTTVNDYLFAQRGYIHREWTKGDCFEAMGCLPLMDTIAPQLEAGLIGLRNNDDNRALVEEWAKWMEDDQILTDAPSLYPNHPDFTEHRHDQSILTNLVLMRGYKMHYVPGVIWNAR